MPGELESECSTNAPKWPQPAVSSVSSHTTATSTKSLHSKFSKFRNQFQPNSLKWPSSKGFCPMFCLALSNKRSILVVCGNYNVSYSMLLGRVGHTRSFLRIFAILRHLHQHCRHLRGQCLHASCIIDQTAGHLSGIQRYKQKLIIEMSKSSKSPLHTLEIVQTRHHIWPSYHWRWVHVVDQRDAIPAQRPVLRSLQQIHGSGGMTLSTALSVYPCSLIMSNIAASCCFFHLLKAPPGTNQRPQRIQKARIQPTSRVQICH